MTTTKTATPIGTAVVGVYNMHFNGCLLQIPFWLYDIILNYIP